MFSDASPKSYGGKFQESHGNKKLFTTDNSFTRIPSKTLMRAEVKPFLLGSEPSKQKMQKCENVPERDCKNDLGKFA